MLPKVNVFVVGLVHIYRIE